MPCSRAPVGRSRRAFSIIELVVSIAVLAVLLGVSVPALRAVRSGGYQLSSQSNVRQLHVFASVYSAGHRELAPIAEAQALYPSVLTPGMYGMPHWDAYRQWVGVLLAEGVVAADEDRSVFVSPGPSPDIVHHNGDYVLSLSLAGVPRIWTEESGYLDVESEAVEKAQRFAAVRFPSDKVVLWDGRARHAAGRLEDVASTADGELRVGVAIAFADGSIATGVPAQMSAPVVNRFEGGSRYGRQRLHNTRLGVLGRDRTTGTNGERAETER